MPLRRITSTGGGNSIIRTPYQHTEDCGQSTQKFLDLNNGSLYRTLGRKYLHKILNESKADSFMGHHIRDAIKDHKLELGLPQDIFSNCLTLLEKCLTPIWITHTWQFMDKYEILFEEMTPNLFLHTLNNSFLMKDFLKVGY